ncbi:HNH endonuclease [Candidatus Parcubacteria bacterium]|nr:MAG: HNH endonuclease [Candidatus Parcubacteria bacterium]
MRRKKWSSQQLINAVEVSSSIRQVLMRLNLIPAGGNYVHISREIKRLQLNTTHFRGKTWNRGLEVPRAPLIPLEDILVADNGFQSFKLKKRLFVAGLKNQKCELCGWSKKSVDGRIPLELDHINGNRRDNRIENLRILCPNCHSLQPTHRGRNIRRRGGEIGHTRTT